LFPNEKEMLQSGEAAHQPAVQAGFLACHTVSLRYDSRILTGLHDALEGHETYAFDSIWGRKLTSPAPPA